jgi:hypothetical protein
VHTRLDRLIDAIDQLVDEQLARGENGGNLDQDRCELCGGPWHGAPTDFAAGAQDLHHPGCPGAFANDTQREQWHRDRERNRGFFRLGRCGLCGGRWHAERGEPARCSQNYRWHPTCPGAFATDAEREQWHHYPGPKTYSVGGCSGSGIRSCTDCLTRNS